MQCAVIKIVISLIINGICLAAGDIDNQLAMTDGASTKIQSCVGKLIEHILNPSESLVFVISSHPDYLPSRLPNPVIVVDVREPLPTHYQRYEVNYVIEAESWALFRKVMGIIIKSSLWHRKESPKGKFVILMKEEKELSTIFFAIWQQIWAVHIIVVIYDDTSKNCPMKIITSNPQAEENNCGKKPPRLFSNFSCDNICQFEFLKPIRNYNGCPVYISPNVPISKFNMNRKGHRIMYNMLAGLKRTLNVTLIFILEGNENRVTKALRDNEIVMHQRYFGINSNGESSMIFLRKLFLWGGPDATRISPLNTLFIPFTYDLWIAVLFITILIILLKWMIMKGNGYNNNYVNLACAFTDIIGLTFGVGVNRIPNIWSLKLLLAFFLVYIIHIHTAYTSDLINVLTEPRYEGVISNVEEVADSGLPIYMLEVVALTYFEKVTDDSVLGKISKLVKVVPAQDINSMSTMIKHFHVLDEDDTVLQHSESNVNSRFLRKRKVSTFLTSDISGEKKFIFQVRNGSYFLQSLNAVITHLWESGTEEADANLNPSLDLPVQMREAESVTQSALDIIFHDHNNIVGPLRLKSLLPIFVIYFVCLSFCIIIFVAEILLHKIVVYITRNQVVPLNV